MSLLQAKVGRFLKTVGAQRGKARRGGPEMNEQQRNRSKSSGTPRTVDELLRTIATQQRVIEEQRQEIARLEDWKRTTTLLVRYHPGRWLIHLARRATRRILPGIGQLRQHEPRELRLPAPDVRLPDVPPTVTIVTPNLNGAAYLERTLLSVLDQGYPALEYIVQDGGSSDGSRAIIERHASRLHHVSFVPDRGRTQALNAGCSIPGVNRALVGAVREVHDVEDRTTSPSAF